MEINILEVLEKLKHYCQGFNNCEDGCKLFGNFGCLLQETVPENYLTEWSGEDELI